MNVHVEYGPEFKRQFKRLAKYDKGEISNVKDEFIESLIKNL